MKIIKTADLQPDDLSRSESLYIYNGLDCAVTYEILEHLLPQLSPVTAATYGLSRSLQGPVLEMNNRGLLVDQERKAETIKDFKIEIYRLTEQVNRMVREGLGFDFPIAKTREYDYPSPDQLRHLFYDHMGIAAKIRVSIAMPSNNWSTTSMQNLSLDIFYDSETLPKKVSFLNTAIDPDGRLRTSFNIAGTRTGRFASSFSDFGTGTNLQNVENRLRAVFVPDPGYKFGNIDLEQADSRGVGAIHWNLFRDSRYLDACESGDLHTTVAISGFPHLTGQADLKS
jgi:DNA polymerase I-like protein with 3'-5' exonuclease and polymerase domains